MIRLLAVLLLISIPAYAENKLVKTHAPVKFEQIVDGRTFIASGRTMRLWGIKAPNKDDAEYLAATLYLETILEDGELRCKFIEKDIDGASIMHCEVDGHDVASMMVQMGMAQDYLRQSNGYYKPEPSEW